MIPRINLFQRVLILAFSLFFFALPIYAILSGKGLVGKGGVPVPFIASVFIGTVSTIFGCVGLWLAVFAKSMTLEELDQFLLLENGARPELSADTLSCRYSLGGKAGGVFIDLAAAQIHFQNCHVRRGFLTSADEWFSCSIDDVVGIHDRYVKKVGACLTIVTRSGHCGIRRQDADYSAVCGQLIELIPTNDPNFIIHDPRMHSIIGTLIAGSGIAGLLSGWWLLPKQAGDTLLAIYLILGTTLGVVGAVFLVAAIDRWLQSRTVSGNRDAGV